MTGLLKSISCAIPQAANRLAVGLADAAQAKHPILKIGSARAHVSKSEQAYETARCKHNAGWNRLINKVKQQIGDSETFAVTRARCLDTLPLGFARPNTVN
jgi:hypothetical protein